MTTHLSPSRGNMVDVITIGSAVVDHIMVVDRRYSEIALGEKVIVKERLAFTGGGATNAAVALSKFGLNVKVITKLGHDPDAAFIRHELATHKIPLIAKTPSRMPTSASAIIVFTADKERIIYGYKGASNDLRADDVPFRLLRRARWVYLASLMGTAYATGKKIARYCADHSIPLLFNASQYLAKKGARQLHHFLRAATILVLNKKEAQLLLETSEEDTMILLKRLHALGPRLVIITNGAKAVYALHGEKGITVRPKKTKVVDTAGAGDAFAATLLGSLVKKNDVHTALKMAVCNAQSVIKEHGAKNGLLTYRQLQQKC